MIGRLFSGPLDIVGDVHGEYAALQHLLAQLGYTSNGEHSQGRRLIFVGDLCDRGPDSPKVLRFVEQLVTRGLAQSVLGNHELNLLCQSRKEGNGWHYDENHDHQEGKFLDAASLVDAAERTSLRRFLSALPLALEREDLRITHAAWHAPSIATARQTTQPAAELYHEINTQIRTDAQATGLIESAEAESRHWAIRLKSHDAPVPLLENIGRLDEALQMNNCVRVITSGVERLADTPFYASGKWRMVDRVAWWNDYTDDTAVIVGHYWRWPGSELQRQYSRGEPDLFANTEPHHWVGAKRNVFCTDFSVGARFKERAKGITANFNTRLAAVRWPEQELVYENGARTPLI